MGAIIGMLVGKQIFGQVIGEKAARAIAYVGLALAALAVFLVAKAIYDHSVIAHHEAQQQVRQVTRERTADANLTNQIGRDQADHQQRQQEIDNATRNIPDQAPSARQRARACLELQRQARLGGKPQPACLSAPPRRRAGHDRRGADQ